MNQEGTLDLVFEANAYSMQARGGITRTYNEIIPRICSYEHINATIVASGKPMQQLPNHENLKKISFSTIDGILRPRRFWRNYYEDISCYLIKDTNRKILHSTYYNTFRGWKGWKVVAVYDMIYERYPELFSSRYDQILREKKRKEILAADQLICNSETTANDLQGFYPSSKGKIVTVYLAPASSFRLQPHDELDNSDIETAPFILYVGERIHYKNFSELISAYKFWKHNEEVFLHVVGRQWSPSEEKQLVEMGIEDKVKVFSNVDDEALCRMYNQAIAFVFPSTYEGFGIPLVEAMACECPIIASPIPSTLEVANDIPIYFQFGNLESFLAALDQVVGEGKNSKRVCKGLEFVKRYSWERTALETVECYRSLV